MTSPVGHRVTGAITDGSDKIVSKRKVKPWTDEQWTKYIVDGVIEAEDIESWTCEQLVQYVLHELNQKSALAYSFLELLLSEEAYGFASDEQKKMLIRLQAEVKEIRALSKIMRCWMSGEGN